MSEHHMAMHHVMCTGLYGQVRESGNECQAMYVYSYYLDVDLLALVLVRTKSVIIITMRERASLVN
jgi:hypothetical protein